MNLVKDCTRLLARNYLIAVLYNTVAYFLDFRLHHLQLLAWLFSNLLPWIC